MNRALEMAGQAADAGADVVLLPEALPFGWTDASGTEESVPIDGWIAAELRAAAKANSIYLCSGIVERERGRCFNSAVLIDPNGEIILHHRKLNELSIAHACYAQGDRLGVADTKFGRFGLMICADAFAQGQVIARTLGYMGAQLILSPCAWAVPPDHDNARTPYGQLWMDNYGPVARDFGLWIAGCSNVGPIRSGAWSGHQCIGSSLVVGPDGAKRLQGSHGECAEETLMVEVTPEVPATRGAEWAEIWRARSLPARAPHGAAREAEGARRSGI